MLPATGIPALDWFLSLLDLWGYLVVFGFTVFENLFVVGSLTPGETVVIAAAAVASRGLLFISGVWFSSVFGTVLGSNISYLLGRRAGLERVRELALRLQSTRIGKLLRIHASALEEVSEHFHTHGSKTVLISRFAVGAKNFVPAMAGATEMPVFWFEAYTLLGAVLYTSAMCAIGWFLGENFDAALKVASSIGYAGLVILALFLVALIVGRRRYRRRKSVRAGDE